MRFELCRAVARCQGRRLLQAMRSAPLPAAIVASLIFFAPIALARVGAMLGKELAPASATSVVATALVLGPCLAAAAAGAVLAISSPSRAGLGQQIAAGPCGDRSAIVAPLLLPVLLATVFVLPSLVALTVSLAGPLPGGHGAGLALSAGVLAAVCVGAVACEGAQIAARGTTSGLLAFGIGACAWMALGRAMGMTALGPLAPVGLALRGVVSPWVALAAACAVAVGLGYTWLVVASRRPERRHRTIRRRHFDAAWRFPIAASALSLVARRTDVRRASVAALGFGLTGALVAIIAGSASPGPFLLATTTTLLGSLVAALALFGILLSGSWMWLAAPRGLGSLAARAWLVGLVAAAIPVGFVGVCSAVTSGVDASTAGVVAVLVLMGTAVATIAGSLVPWRGDGIGDQLSAVTAFMVVALATSFAIGLVAPRLTTLGLPDPGIAIVLCGIFALGANAILVHRLHGGAR
jgi:hypothetical protein